GLSLVGDLFVNQGDTILLPEHNCVNNKIVFNTRNGANLQTYPIFDKDGHYTTDSLLEALQSYNKDKVIMILNYTKNQT
ncbi:aspartate aminotransferase, partial [Staphylococcus aureus]|nr:aspartate aminotransferase [Staphylococcus aureus]